VPALIKWKVTVTVAVVPLPTLTEPKFTGVLPQALSDPPQRAITKTAEKRNDRRSLLTFTDNLHSGFLFVTIFYSRFTGVMCSTSHPFHKHLFWEA
jgi:hypothetical protein